MKSIFIIAVLLVLDLAALAQPPVHQGDGAGAYKDGFVIHLDTSGNKFIRFMTWATFWARHTAANPGTAVNGIPQTGWSDFSLRQYRLVMISQLGPRYLIMADLGIDNQSFSTGGVPGGGNTGNGSSTFSGSLGKKPGLYIHDLWNEYTVLAKTDPATGRRRLFSLYIGTGLHYWVGISRLTSCSSASYLALDVPLYNWPLVDLSDQFARQLGVYMKGDLGPVSWRWAINKPYTVSIPAQKFAAAAPDSGYAVDNNQTGKMATTGYAAWQFLDHENDVLPYTTGTYLGAMRVLNVGAGYYYSAQGTTTQATNSASSTLIRHNIALWSGDVFADLPFGGPANWAFTGYSVFYHYNFGHGYLRDVSIMNANVAESAGYTGPVSQAGFGNLAPSIGTGNTWYSQAGILLPKTILRGKIRFQPFGEFSRQQFDRYGSALFTFWGAGGNILLDGHHARLTVKYQTRPLVADDRQSGSKGTYVVATQVYL
jgi:hypothetical protein